MRKSTANMTADELAALQKSDEPTWRCVVARWSIVTPGKIIRSDLEDTEREHLEEKVKDILGCGEGWRLVEPIKRS